MTGDSGDLDPPEHAEIDLRLGHADQPWVKMSGMEATTRPWGQYEVLSDASDHKVKRIFVEPGRRISYQRHTQRSEHWFFVQGEGLAVLDATEFPVGPGDTIDIPAGTAHRIENLHETAPLVFIEVQHGTYFGEDDIIRLEDDYGRV